LRSSQSCRPAWSTQADGCARRRAAARERPGGRHPGPCGKERLASITKQGDRYLRQLLIVGALAVVKYAQRNGTRRPWLVQLLARRTTKVATVALANKTARIVWAIMSTGGTYREPELQAA
jgi:transposase